MLATALISAVWLAAAPPAPCSTEDTTATRLGPAGDPDVVAYLDPADRDALRTWVGLRALSTERPRLRIEVHLADPGDQDDPPRADVRAWTLQVARAGKLTAALRLAASDEWEWLAARIATKAGRAQLATAVGDPSAGRAPTACARRHIAHDADVVAAHFRRFGNPVFRLPVFVVDDVVFDDPPGLARVRTELARAGARTRDRIDPPIRAPVPTPKATSARMRRPRLSGILLGGPGLPHRFVLMANSEDDQNLFGMLPALLQFRAEHPGELAVHITARGSSLGAAKLRHRLCAARRLGLGRAYADVLATPPVPDDPGPPPDVLALRKRLDAVPEAQCEDELDPAQLDLPDGAWLDGLPRTRAELGNLPATLGLLDAAVRPLAPLVRARSDDP